MARSKQILIQTLIQKYNFKNVLRSMWVSYVKLKFTPHFTEAQLRTTR